MDTEAIKKIAKLCKLELSDNEIELYKDQFQKILAYIEQLSEVNVVGIEPYMTPITNKLRADKINKDNMIDKKTALSLSKNHNDDYFVVSKVSVK
jgi:aspartyl-tRNA(Asn)/glutamyl-tRNA(Gln) amidotransferase subunit C